MTQAAHSSVIKTTGTSTAVSGGACTDLGSHTAYQITDTAKRVMDPAAAVVVYKDTGSGAVAQASSLYTIDGLTGTITFLSALGGSDVVTVDYSYLPLLSVAAGKEFSIECMSELADKTTFDSGGTRERMAVMRSAKGTLGLIALLNEDLDAGAGSRKLADVLQNGTMVYLEVQPGGAGQKFRAYVHLENTDTKGGVAVLIESTLAWRTTLVPNTFTNSYSWST